ncbi:MAG: hypothetical protein ACJ8FT_06060 [Sphingomonas sp.]
MLVYGDHSEIAEAGERLDAIRQALAAVSAMPTGIDRHAKLVGTLIEVGRLLQGVADAGLPDAEALGRFLHQLACTVLRSWDSGFAETGSLPPVPRIGRAARVELRVPEGFAFYAVYPEAYADAARRLKVIAPPRVIGIRSIGTTLGAMVSAALGAPPPITVRPFGDPFARRAELPPEVIGQDVHYVIVDEGPGLSGSSFGAVADWLEARAVPLERIAFITSHAGNPGPQASQAHRQRWSAAQRVAAEFDPAFLAKAFGRLEEFSIGSQWERRKFLARPGGERVLLKFAGLGAIGERKFEMARALHAAGFTPEPLGLVHGFLVERWCEGGRPLAADDRPVEAIGRYIGARARLFPADDRSGASIEELRTMCRRNISLALGGHAARAAERFDVEALSRSVRPVRTDNKLDRCEWLRVDDGRLVKVDALDHHHGHDLIGCQDAAWDVAGAAVEFGLTAAETDGLIAATGLKVDRELLEFCRIAYCSFRLGQAALARATAAASRYSRALELLLHDCAQPATRRDSSVGGMAERTASGTNPRPFG